MLQLTEQDKVLLRKWGYTPSDYKQIEDCMNNATFEIWGDNIDDCNHISVDTALWYCGRRNFLNGCSRAAFHASAVRDTRFKTRQVYFHYKF